MHISVIALYIMPLQFVWPLDQVIVILFPAVLRYLIKFLGKLSENSEVNKMSASNIAIVIAPNIIWSLEDEG